MPFGSRLHLLAASPSPRPSPSGGRGSYLFTLRPTLTCSLFVCNIRYVPKTATEDRASPSRAREFEVRMQIGKNRAIRTTCAHRPPAMAHATAQLGSSPPEGRAQIGPRGDIPSWFFAEQTDQFPLADDCDTGGTPPATFCKTNATWRGGVANVTSTIKALCRGALQPTEVGRTNGATGHLFIDWRRRKGWDNLNPNAPIPVEPQDVVLHEPKEAIR